MRQKEFYAKSVNCDNNFIRCRNMLGLRSKHRMMMKFTVVVYELGQVPSWKSVQRGHKLQDNCRSILGVYLQF
jgi:hypothetical protein